jgi:hypothetical protein
MWSIIITIIVNPITIVNDIMTGNIVPILIPVVMMMFEELWVLSVYVTLNHYLEHP